MHLLNKDRIGALVVLVCCTLAWSMLDTMPAEAALFPRMIISMAFVLSAIWGISSLRPRAKAAASGTGEVPEGFMENPRNFAIFAACLAAYIVLIDTIGYFTSSALFVIVTSFLLGFRRPLTVVVSAAGFVLFIYLVFVVIFNRPLPVEFFQPQ